MSVFAGAKDVVTPPGTAESLLSAPTTVDIQVSENAGHYDFMTELPPEVTPTPGLDHKEFLNELAADVTAAAIGKPSE